MDAAKNTDRTGRAEDRRRLLEIMDVVRRHDILTGITPDKLCGILSDLGPTFVKLGQILSMRSDILPASYCEALASLRSSVPPMPCGEVTRIIERSYGRPIGEVFASFDEHALGSASIAQAHAAVLSTGEQVVVKVQRDGIHETMSRDISLLKKACRMLKYTPAGGLVDFNQVLDEMWLAARQEMNFSVEADNLEKFRALNKNVSSVSCPALFREYTTASVLVMSRVDGCAIDDLDAIRAAGADPADIGAKLADSYVKQIMDDGFFHADPHPGNLRLQDGKIVWLDMGMMGTLTERERRLIGSAVAAAARNDVPAVCDAICALAVRRGETDRARLSQDVEAMMERYVSGDIGSIDIALLMQDCTDVMHRNSMAMPAGLTLLVRGMTAIEGVIAKLSPELSLMSVIVSRTGRSLLRDLDLRTSLPRDAAAFYDSAQKSLGIPAQLADLLKAGLKGEAALTNTVRLASDTKEQIDQAARRVCGAAVSAALIVCAGLLRDTPPLAGGISWYSVACFAAAAALPLVRRAAEFFKRHR